MNDALRWLLDLDSLSPGMSGVEFGFERPIPAWAWALVVLIAAAFAWRAYRRLEGSVPARAMLGSLRAALLVLLVLLLTGPRLVKPNETEEKDWVIILADRSASMTMKDAPATAGGASGARITRDAQLAGALAGAGDELTKLAEDRTVLWLGFDSGAFELGRNQPAPPSSPESAPGASAAVALGEPAGRRTSVGRAIEQALRRAAARPVSGVIILSDGRSADEPSRAVMRRLEAERIPVFAVPLGAAEALADLAVREVESPRLAFVRDAVPVQVEIEQIGGDSPIGGAVAELVDQDTGEVLDSKPVEWNQAGSNEPATTRSAQVTLTHKPTRAGTSRWAVRIRPGSGAGPDLIEANNESDFAIELVDRPVRVLAIDGYPRWESRFLRSLLVREETIAAAALLLAPGRRYLQEGAITMDALPRSPEEWAQFDLFIIGDVYPGVFAPEQLAQLRERIAIGGAGLIFIGGDGSMPGAWRNTVLADLLPFSLSEGVGITTRTGGGLPTFGGPVLMKPTLAAERLGVLRLADVPDAEGLYWPGVLSDTATGWSNLYWAQRIDPSILKPTAEVLAVAEPADGSTAADGTTPLVLSMRFGAGRVLYVATDEIWRWRYGRGELLPERFWLQMVRLLGRESLARSGKPAMLEVSPRRGEVDRPAQIELTLLDQAMVQASPGSMRVRITREGNVDDDRASTSPEEAVVTELPLGPADERRGAAAAARSFSATWLPTMSGRYQIEAVDPLIRAAGGLSLRTEVWQANDELRTPQTDHPALARLAEATGGKVLEAAELAQVAKLLPNRRLRLAGEPDIETLWDTPLALLVVVLIITVEWIGRRLLKLA